MFSGENEKYNELFAAFSHFVLTLSKKRVSLVAALEPAAKALKKIEKFCESVTNQKKILVFI